VFFVHPPLSFLSPSLSFLSYLEKAGRAGQRLIPDLDQSAVDVDGDLDGEGEGRE